METFVQPVTIPPAASSRPKVKRMRPLSSTIVLAAVGNA